MRVFALAIVSLSIGLAAQAPQSAVVPAAYVTLDAPSRMEVPGLFQDLRQQILVGSSHLVALANRQITSLAFRRSASAEVMPGGAATLSVSLSTLSKAAVECSPAFADNVGANAVTVFQGLVSVPASPAATGPSIAWSADNIVSIQFAQPFLYGGGTLAIDIVGTTVPGQIAAWWLADAAFDSATGTAVDLGPGCGPHAHALGQWSWASPHTLVPGSSAQLDAYGTVGNPVATAFGPAGTPFPLAPLGLGQPGCNSYLVGVDMLFFGQFQPLGDPRLASAGGHAECIVAIPNVPWLFGAQLAAQWLDLAALHSSNAVLCTIAPAAPTLDMALVDGVAAEATGEVSNHRAHVLRFDYL